MGPQLEQGPGELLTKANKSTGAGSRIGEAKQGHEWLLWNECPHVDAQHLIAPVTVSARGDLSLRGAIAYNMQVLRSGFFRAVTSRVITFFSMI